jgi:hypothetical protein
VVCALNGTEFPFGQSEQADSGKENHKNTAKTALVENHDAEAKIPRAKAAEKA